MKTALLDTLMDKSYVVSGYDHIGMPFYELDAYVLANLIITECLLVVDEENAEGEL